MKAALVSIGNSKGIRIPASVIKACGFGDTLDMHVQDNVLVLKATVSTRSGWDAAFTQMAAAGDDTPLLPENGNEFDDKEWAW